MFKFLAKLFGAKKPQKNGRGNWSTKPISQEKIIEARKMYAAGKSSEEICKKTGLSMTSFYKYVTNQEKQKKTKWEDKGVVNSSLTDDKILQIKSRIDSGVDTHKACRDAGISWGYYYRRLRLMKDKTIPIHTNAASYKEPVKTIPIPRQNGGDPAVWATLMRAPKKGKINMVHVYSVLNDANWISAKEVAEKLGCSIQKISGVIYLLNKYGYVEYIKKNTEERANLMHFRRKVPYLPKQTEREPLKLSSLEDLKVLNG